MNTGFVPVKVVGRGRRKQSNPSAKISFGAYLGIPTRTSMSTTRSCGSTRVPLDESSFVRPWVSSYIA
eukprot:637764-Rhodomonas_salina.2